MLQNQNPYHFKMTKRLLYQQITDEANPEVMVGSSRSTDRKAMRERLAQLEGQVHNREQREHLADLRESVDFQRDAIAEDGREVQDLLRLAQLQGGLDTQEVRQQFFSNLEQRLTVLMSLLVQSGQIQASELRKKSITNVLSGKNPEQMQVRFRGSNRQLFEHEKELLRLPGILNNHSNNDVQESWGETAYKVRAYAGVMTAFGIDFTESGEDSGSGITSLLSGLELDEEQQEMLGQAKEYWREMHPMAKAAVMATAVYGAWSIYKWIFKRGASDEPGSLSRIGFLVAGGVFVAGGIFGYKAIWEKIKGLFVGLSRGQFLRGIRAVISGDWDEAKRAWGSFSDGLLQRLGLGEHAGRTSSPQPERTNSGTNLPETATQNREDLRYNATMNSLIGFYCFNERSYPAADKVEIRQVFNAMRGQSVHSIANLWQQHKNSSSLTIPHNTGVVQIANNIQEKNIFTAVRIIGTTYEAYQRRFNIQSSTPMTLGQFLERVAGDPLHEVSSSIHEALLQVAADGSINLSQLNLDRLRNHFAQRQRQHTTMVCSRLGVNIESLTDQEKNDFYAIAASLYTSATLDQTTDQALQNITTGRSSRAIEKAREFFTQTKQRTLQTVVPGIISRFNIATPQNAENANILRDNLTEERMTFGHAFQLNVVSANFDFAQSNAVSEVEELTLLFVALNGLSTEQRNRYYSELSYLMLNADTNISLPSLARLKPYFARITSLAGEVLENKGRTLLELLSAFANERTADQEQVFQERVRNSDWLEFGLLSGQEGVRGSYLVGKDIALTLASVGATYEDFGSVEDVGDLLSLTFQLGGALILPAESDGNTTGMIYLAGKYFFIKPIGIGWNTLKATASDGPGAAIKTYVVGASPYVLIGAAGGVISGGGWRGIIRGAARGLAAPITAPIEGIRIGQRALEAGRQLFTRGTLPNLLRNAQMVEYYKAQVPRNLQVGEWLSSTGAREGLRRTIVGNWNVSRYNTFLHNFRRSYNNFFGFSDAQGIIFRRGEMEIAARQVLEATERLQNFTRSLSAHPEYARATDVDTLKSLVQRVGGNGVLSEAELTKLVTKVETSGGVQSLRSSIDAGAEMLSSAPRTSRARAAFTAAVEGYRNWRAARGLETPTPTTAASAVDTVQQPLARAASVADTFQAIRAGEAIDISRIAQLDAALRTPEGIQEARRTLSAMGVADDQIEGVIRSVRTAENPVSLSQALQRAGVIADAPSSALAPSAATALREATQLSAHLDEALGTIRNGGQINWRQLGALRQAAQTDGFVAQLRQAGVAAEKADELATVLRTRRELGIIAESLEGVNSSVKLSRGLTGMMKVARVAGPAMAAAGFAAGGLEAWQSWAVADEIKNNDELRDLYNQRGNANFAAAIGNLVVDVAAIGGAISGMAAVPLAVIIGNIAYVYNAASDASIEIAKTEEDWRKEMNNKAFEAAGVVIREGVELTDEQVRAVQRQSVNLMLHAIVNTTEDDSAGENFNALFTSNTVESFMEERANTRQKMMWAVLKIEKPGKNDDYYKYAFKAIDVKVGNFNFDNIEHGMKIIAESLIFADIMSERDQVLTYQYGSAAASEPTVPASQRESLLRSEGIFDNGQERVLNLQHNKFDAQNITNREIFMVINTGEHLVETSLQSILGNELFERIERLDKNYLNYAINIMMMYVKNTPSPEAIAGKNPQQVAETAELIRRYLMFEGYQFEPNPSLGDPAAHMEDIAKILFDASLSEEQVTESMGHFNPRSKGIAAIYVYAQAYGFKKAPSILNLQRFFEGEGKKGYMGLYFRKNSDLPGGGEWVVNEEGLESDNEVGYNPDVAALKIIEEIRDEPDNILTSRFDYFADAFVTRDDEVKRAEWMLELANRMERAYGSSTASVNTQEYQTPTEAAVESLATDTSRGYQSLANDPTTGLRMAAEQANDQIVDSLDSVTGGRYSSTVNGIRNKVGSLLGGILD